MTFHGPEVITLPDGRKTRLLAMSRFEVLGLANFYQRHNGNPYLIDALLKYQHTLQWETDTKSVSPRNGNGGDGGDFDPPAPRAA